MDDIRPDGPRSNRIPNLGKIHKQMKKIILSILLIAYAVLSSTFMGSAYGDWAGYGIIFCIPCWLIIGGYYLYLIWRKEKAAGADILLLPLLQKIGIYKSYDDTERDKKNLVKTSLPFLLSLATCPLLASVLTECDRDFNGILLIMIAPVVLIISLVLGAKQDWLNKSKQN